MAEQAPAPALVETGSTAEAVVTPPETHIDSSVPAETTPTPVDEEEQKKRRLERFGTADAVNEDETKLQARAARFGAAEQNEDEAAALKKRRAERFGVPATETIPPPVEEERKRKRAERFGGQVSEAPEDLEKRAQRAERFGEVEFEFAKRVRHPRRGKKNGKQAEDPKISERQKRFGIS
eukprot:TRINITY_DN1269_c0_g1_i1.p2 TRINITY_DN1269_c0_g1~~TRINITY_DN1269_c0_g1_i1.p2  ORF type:complete len:187 (+),score=46.92 TRINITY_DN1269_c0_g1_i1:24-563(+)